MHQITHCLWAAILADHMDHIYTNNFNFCYLPLLYAYIINSNNSWDGLVKRPAAERHAYGPAMPTQYEVTWVFKRH